MRRAKLRSQKRELKSLWGLDYINRSIVSFREIYNRKRAKCELKRVVW
jgi:hypothetical protein